MFILKLLKNKYFIAVIGMIIWLLYFDRNDVFTQLDLINKCRKLNDEKEYYVKEIEKNRQEVYELQNNLKSLETFAREKYYMKKDNEDVFIFVEKETTVSASK